MAVGSYGIVRPADVSPDDVEILYHYVSGRTSTAPVTLKKLTSNEVLFICFDLILSSYDDDIYVK